MFEPIFHFDSARMLAGLGLAALMAATAWRLRALSVSGAVAATLLGGLTFGIGGWPAAILLILFFASSSLLSKLFAPRKRAVAKAFAKGGRRDWAQVLANGGPGLIVLLLAASGVLPALLAWGAYVAVLAAVNADTWATELGVLSRAQPRLITTGKPAPKGTSGAVSLLGSAAALAGAALIALVAAWLGDSHFVLPFIVLVTLAGLLGSFFDSLLGATYQAIYYCPQCKKETERYPLHNCGTKTKLTRGLPWLDNDLVNFLAAVLAGFVAAAVQIWL
jgi:uncharacterized protein (TIGR00297 family)